ncbi:MAG: response regulator [Pseudomonadota bacterium]
MSEPNILMLDDDAELAAMVCRYLRENGMSAHAVHDGAALDRWLALRRPDLIVLDVMLPGEDGLSIARRLKAASDVPILMLSARGGDVDRIVGLEIGADDYLAKPFNPRELLARIRARLRERAPRPAAAVPDCLRAGVFELDLARRVARRAGETLDLSTAEFALLRVFLGHANRVLSRAQLVELAQGVERLPFERSIDVRVTRLRKKIEANPADPRHLRTVWGSGYLFVPDGEGGA